MMIAVKCPAVEKQAGLCIHQIFDMDKELPDTLLQVILTVQEPSHFCEEQHCHIERIVPKLIVIAVAADNVLQTMLLRARERMHHALGPLRQKRQIGFVLRLLINGCQCQHRAGRVDVLLRQSLLDLSVKPASQIGKHGLIAAGLVILEHSKQRNALRPFPRIHRNNADRAGFPNRAVRLHFLDFFKDQAGFRVQIRFIRRIQPQCAAIWNRAARRGYPQAVPARFRPSACQQICLYRVIVPLRGIAAPDRQRENSAGIIQLCGVEFCARAVIAR